MRLGTGRAHRRGPGFVEMGWRGMTLQIGSAIVESARWIGEFGDDEP